MLGSAPIKWKPTTHRTSGPNEGGGSDFDLNCRALTAELVVSGTTVEWRAIAWQVDYEPLDLEEQEQPVITLPFDRRQYEAVVRPLLTALTES